MPPAVKSPITPRAANRRRVFVLMMINFTNFAPLSASVADRAFRTAFREKLQNEIARPACSTGRAIFSKSSGDSVNFATCRRDA